MSHDLTDALQDCLERLEAGERLEQVLDRHGRRSEELRALLDAAHLVRRHRPRPSPAFRARAQTALAQMDLSPEAAGDRSSTRGAWSWLASRWAFRGGAAALAMVLLAAGTVAASANARPGDALYPLARGLARARIIAVETADDWMDRARVAVAPLSGSAPALAPGPRAAATTPRLARSRPSEAQTDPESAASRGGAAALPGSPAGASPAAGPSGRAGAPGARSAAPAAGLPGPTASPSAEAPPDLALSEPAPGADPDASAGAPPLPAPSATPAAVEPTALPPLGPEQGSVPLPGDPRRWRGSYRPARMTGQVLREDGEPMGRGVMVAAYPLGPTGELSWWVHFDTWTDSEGRYRFDNLPPGTYKVMASLPQSWGNWRWHPSAARSRDAEVVLLVAGETREAIDIRFDRLPPWLDWWRLLPRGPAG